MKVSNCCGASIIENTDLCSDCKEHCEVVEQAEYYEEDDIDWLSSDFEPKSIKFNGKEIK